MTKAVGAGWFEIPVSDLDRASRFYERAFAVELSRDDYGPVQMYKFPWEQGAWGAPGALVSSDAHVPSQGGAVVYFQIDDIDSALARVEEGGGKALVAKTSMGGYGFTAMFEDSEGNRIGLMSHG